jgi:hypothetical protein
MTAYFDEKTAALRDIADRLCRLDEWSDPWQAVRVELDALDRAIVWDVSVCAEMPGFPPELREPIAHAVLAHSVGGQPVNSQGLDVEETREHVKHVASLIWDLHTIFHEVGRGRPQRPGDRFGGMMRLFGLVKKSLFSILLFGEVMRAIGCALIDRSRGEVAFDDDPRTPLRCLYARGEELRERMVEASGRAIRFAAVEPETAP